MRTWRQVGVRDYGFDAAGQPYFTMELRERPQTIVAAGQGMRVDQVID